MSIRDDFFANQAVAALWDVAVSIKRGNPLPLDSNSVFKSYADLETYASGVLSYPGQIVAVVNADSTEIYYLDQELNIQPVGSVPSADNKSIEVVDGVLSLYNYAKAFYKYIAEETDEEGKVTEPAHYEKVEVSEENPWTAGLEPRVVEEDGEFVIGWYQPDTSVVESLSNKVTNLEESIEDLTAVIGEPGNGEDSPATGIFLELEKKANIGDVEDLIANIDHLKRKIFTSEEEILAFIAENEDTAGSYIYMLPSGLEFDSNKYYEYIYIDGALEQVGNWEIDLDDYLTEGEVTELLQDYYTEEEIDGFLADYALKTDLNSYYTSEQINNLLLNYYSATKIDTLLNGYVQKEEGKSLVSDTEINKLKTVKENAEPNYIKSVTSNFKVSEAGQLSLETISIGKVEDLQDALDAKVNSVFTTNEDGSKTPWTLLSPENQEKLAALTIGDNGDLSISGKVNAENVEGLASWITTNRDTVDGLFSSVEAGKLKEIETGAQVNFINSVNEDIFTVDENKTLDLKNAYVLQSVFDNKVGNLDELILSEEKTNLVEQVNYLSERMTWYEITQS